MVLLDSFLCKGDIDATGGIITCRAIDAGSGIGTFGGLDLNGGGITSTANIDAGTGIITCGGLNLNNGRGCCLLVILMLRQDLLLVVD